jgi:hypothetical protein
MFRELSVICMLQRKSFEPGCAPQIKEEVFEGLSSGGYRLLRQEVSGAEAL